MSKVRTFWVDVEESDVALAGGIDRLADYVKSLMEDLSDGDRVTVEIVRQDFTQAELDAMPVQ